MSNKAELVIAALQQRIGELELQNAILRAEYTELVNTSDKKETTDEDSN